MKRDSSDSARPDVPPPPRAEPTESAQPSPGWGPPLLGGAARTMQLWGAAAIAGALAAAATIGFRALIELVEWLFTRHVGGLVAVAESLAGWRRAAVATAGGVCAGLALYAGLRWAARGPGGAKHIDYIDAARREEVALNDRTTLARTVSALLSVGTGASIGREGPMVQLSAWLASTLARLLPLPDHERNAIFVCGIAAGIGSAYHAPIAGVVFVLELALGFFARHTVAPVLIAAATAAALIHWLVAPQPLYVMPAVRLLPASLVIALAAGVVCGGFGWALLELLEGARHVFRRIHALPLRLGIGGALVGLLSVAVPEVWGNGYSVVSQVLQGDLAWRWVAMLLVAKVVATVLSNGSGAIGGVFTPTLFVGATTGYAMAGVCATWIDPALVGDPRAMALIGMAAVLSAVTHAPLMAIVMVLEMTSQFQLAIPVMLASGVAYAVSTQFGARPLYGNPIEAHR